MSDSNDLSFPVERDTALQRGSGMRSGLAQFAAGGGSALTGPGNPTQTGGFNPNEIIRIIMKWRMLIIPALIAGPVIAFLYSLTITPIYRASSTIEIQNEGPQIIKFGGDQERVVSNSEQMLATQVGILRSESLAGRVVSSQRLATNPDFIGQSGTMEQRRNSAVSRVLGALSVEPVRSSRLVNLVIKSPSPAMAATLSGAYVDEFIRFNLDQKFGATSYARSFLQERLASTKAKLEHSERALVQYAQSRGIIDLTASSGNNSAQGGSGQSSLDANSLVAVNGDLIQARNDRIAAEARYRQLVSNGNSTETLQNSTVSTLSGQLAQERADYQDKLSTFLPGLPAMVAQRAKIAALEQQIRGAKGNVVTAVRSEFNAAVSRENALAARVSQLRSAVLSLRDRSIDYTILQREVDTNRALYDALLQRYKEVGVAPGLGTNAISIVDRAKVPRAPISPNIPTNVMIGLLIGALAGFGLAFLIEFIDDTIKSPDDVTNKLGLTALGVVPETKSKEPMATLLADPRSVVTEAFYSLRTALQFATGHGTPRTLMVTSSRASEGKSSSVLGLAVSFARLNKTVLIIDADLRKPAFRVPDRIQRGLTNLLSGSEDYADVVLETSTPNLFLCPSGPRVPNPAELLGTPRLAQILDQYTQHFDLVIVDSPPVLGLADAPLIGSVCEGALLVIETSNVRRLVAANSVARLQASDTRLLGAILNKYNPKRAGYGYGYGYGYGSSAYTYGEGDSDNKPRSRIELLS